MISNAFISNNLGRSWQTTPVKVWQWPQAWSEGEPSCGQDLGAAQPGSSLGLSSNQAPHISLGPPKYVTYFNDRMESLCEWKQAQSLEKFLQKGLHKDRRTGAEQEKELENKIRISAVRCHVLSAAHAAGAVIVLTMKSTRISPTSVILAINSIWLWLSNVSDTNNRKFPIKRDNLLSEKEQ